MSPVTANAATDTALAEPRAGLTSLRVVLVGPPGAGKGTQAKVIASRLGVPSVATGDIFRASVKEDTPLGRQAREIMRAGALMPDELTIDLVRDRLTRPDTCAGFLLDGFPRTLTQAAALDEFLDGTGRRIDAALSLALDNNEVIRRLSGRRMCHGCKPPRIWHIEHEPPVKPGICDDCGGELYLRDDDAPATVRARLTAYAHSTAPLIDFYQTQGKLAAIDALGPVEDITRRAIDALRPYTS